MGDLIQKIIHLQKKVYDKKYPINYIEINRASKECNNTKRVHPTQKPVELMEYLIKTYTNEDELVLDFTMGSGSTGVACLNTNRKFIGIELDEGYFNIATNRIKGIDYAWSMEYESQFIDETNNSDD